MKVGQKVSFYIKQGRTEKRLFGTVVAFNDLVATVLPDGKKKAVTVDKNDILEVWK